MNVTIASVPPSAYAISDPLSDAVAVAPVETKLTWRVPPIMEFPVGSAAVPVAVPGEATGLTRFADSIGCPTLKSSIIRADATRTCPNKARIKNKKTTPLIRVKPFFTRSVRLEKLFNILNISDRQCAFLERPIYHQQTLEFIIIMP